MIIQLNNKFYSRECIEQSALAFAGLFDHTVSFAGNLATIDIKNLKEDSEETKGEFQNYCLSWMKQNGGIQGCSVRVDLPEPKVSDGISKSHFISPYKMRRLDDKYLITTDHGGWAILRKEEYDRLVKCDIDYDLGRKLATNLILVTRENSRQVIARYRNKYIFLEKQPTLHIIELTNSCDHNCAYCHAKAGICEEPEVRMLTLETADRILDSIFDNAKDAVSIELQGGEPTLNFGVVKHILERISLHEKSKGIRINKTIVTNLVNITQDQIETLISYECAICTSLDGPGRVHDANRKQGSHEKVVSNIRKIKYIYEYPVGMLLTITNESLPFSKEIIDEYVGLGSPVIHIRKTKNIGNAQTSTIVPSAEEYIKFWKKSFEYILKLNQEGTRIQERYVTIILKKILGIPILYSDLQSPCGMATGQIAYTSDGRIYSCDMARGREFFRIGEIGKDGQKIMNDEVRGMILSSINDAPACQCCAFQTYCGLCPVMMKTETGTLGANPKKTELCKINNAIFTEVFKALAEKEKALVLSSWIR